MDELEYNWGGLQAQGSVSIRNAGEHVTHSLTFDGHPIATFRKRVDEPDEEGETRLEHHNQLVGKGNLLAGVLLFYGLKKRKEERQFSLKEFFPELFPSPQGREVL